MVYAYIIKKNEKDSGLSPVLMLLQNYTSLYGVNDFIVCLPGYLSKTRPNLDNFTYLFTIKKSPTVTQRGYFFSGMNGRSIPKSLGMSIQQYVNRLFGGFSTSIKDPKDHSKIVIFFEYDEKYITASSKNIDSLIKNSKVKAILLGSSNQSFKSYIKSPADKGETDIFLVDTSIFNEEDALAITLKNNISEFNNSIILTKEIDSKSSLRDIVNDIFRI